MGGGLLTGIAQLVEHRSPKPRVVGSSPPSGGGLLTGIAQLVEHRSPKPRVVGSSPPSRAEKIEKKDV